MCIRDSYVAGAVLRGLLVGSIVLLIAMFFTTVRVPHPFVTLTTAVSYTHLDVYKRQPSNSAVAEPPGTKLTAISTVSPASSAWSCMVARE